MPHTVHLDPRLGSLLVLCAAALAQPASAADVVYLMGTVRDFM